MATKIFHGCSVCDHVLEGDEECCPEHPDATILSLVGGEGGGWSDGDRVEGGATADDYDTGRVYYRDGEVWVAWDSGVQTRAVDAVDLRPEGERPIGAQA